jgi:hypothetical protein
MSSQALPVDPVAGLEPAGRSAGSRARAADLVPIGLLTAFTLILRVSQIHQSLVGDEVFTYHDVVGRSFASVLSNVHAGGENSPPLFFLLAWLSSKLGDPTVWIRLPSILLGAATLPVIYAIGRRTVGRGAGLAGAAIVALSPFSLYFGVEARPYATMAFLVALSTLALLNAVAGRSRWWWLVYPVAAAAAAYSHYTCIFVLAVQAVWSLWACRHRPRDAIAANLLIAVLYVPWLPNIRGKQLDVIAQLQPFTARNVLGDLIRVIPGYPYGSLGQIPSVAGIVAFVGCVAAGLIAWGLNRRRSAGGRPDGRLGLLVALAVATPIGLFLYSLLGADLWLARGLYASVPAAAVVLGFLLLALPRRWQPLAFALVLATLTFGVIRGLGQPFARPPFRAMAAYLDRAAAATDPIELASLPGAPAITAQMRRPHVFISTGSEPRRAAAGHSQGHFFLVVDRTLGRVLGITRPAEPGYRLVDVRHYGGEFPTRILVYSRIAGRSSR